jgi:hypothetical protein
MIWKEVFFRVFIWCLFLLLSLRTRLILPKMKVITHLNLVEERKRVNVNQDTSCLPLIFLCLR